jgi:hypothetical protein
MGKHRVMQMCRKMAENHLTRFFLLVAYDAPVCLVVRLQQDGNGHE